MSDWLILYGILAIDVLGALAAFWLFIHFQSTSWRWQVVMFIFIGAVGLIAEAFALIGFIQSGIIPADGWPPSWAFKDCGITGLLWYMVLHPNRG